MIVTTVPPKVLPEFGDIPTISGFVSSGPTGDPPQAERSRLNITGALRTIGKIGCAGRKRRIAKIIHRPRLTAHRRSICVVLEHDATACTPGPRPLHNEASIVLLSGATRSRFAGLPLANDSGIRIDPVSLPFSLLNTGAFGPHGAGARR
ncbi:MAG: hypothetical protein QM736_03650 [Vicinamibacterales bacterium]